MFEVNGKQYEVDEDGFLQSPELWNREVALDFATTEGLSDLTEAHWKLINYIRTYWKENDIAPMVRRLCKETGFKAQRDLRHVPVWSGQGRVQSRGSAEADRMRVARYESALAARDFFSAPALVARSDL